jgi:uncharacterized protein (DUF4415 family)
MAIVTTKVQVGQKPTRKQIAEVERAAKFPIAYSKDSPKSSGEAIAEFAKQAKRKQKKRTIISINVKNESLSAFKSYGKNYASAMSGVIDYVAKHPKTLARMLV